MKLTLAEPKLIKDSITLISDLVNEARFKVTADAMELVAMDPANVAMVVFKLLSSSFVEYEIKEDTEITVNLSNLKQILRRAGPNDMLTLETPQESKLKITLKGKGQRTFYLPILESEGKEQKVPELSFEAKIDTPCQMLNSAIEDADIVADSCSFIADEKKLSINAEGDMSKVNIDIPASEETKIITAGKDKIRSKYSIEYLKKMMGGSKISDTVKVQFSKDYPLKLDYTAVDKLSVSFILAPRVDND